jgi:hypothetical protein
MTAAASRTTGTDCENACAASTSARRAAAIIRLGNTWESPRRRYDEIDGVCARGLPHSKSSVGSNSARPTPGVNPTEKLARPGAQKSASIDGTELAQSRAPAAATLMTLLEQARSEHVRKDVAVTLLGYSGIHAGIASGPVVNIGIGAGVGYIIDLSGPPGDQNGSRSHLSAVGGVIYDHEPAALVDVTPEDEQ